MVQYVNNYYISDGYTASSLNNMGIWLVNRQTLARQKPDCSSKVEGMVVRVTNKYKKWIEVTWMDKNEKACTGWIQNYKTSLFKNR